jgi:hypothetical protein
MLQAEWRALAPSLWAGPAGRPGLAESSAVASAGRHCARARLLGLAWAGGGRRSEQTGGQEQSRRRRRQPDNIIRHDHDDKHDDERASLSPAALPGAGLLLASRGFRRAFAANKIPRRQ